MRAGRKIVIQISISQCRSSCFSMSCVRNDLMDVFKKLSDILMASTNVEWNQAIHPTFSFSGDWRHKLEKFNQTISKWKILSDKIFPNKSSQNLSGCFWKCTSFLLKFETRHLKVCCMSQLCRFDINKSFRCVSTQSRWKICIILENYLS